MKRFYLIALLLTGLAFLAGGYDDSTEIKTDTVSYLDQASIEDDFVAINFVANSDAVLPVQIKLSEIEKVYYEPIYKGEIFYSPNFGLIRNRSPGNII
jgi:hypothetical protein